jgi:hypothetical protein
MADEPVPEADALEQARPVVEDEDDEELDTRPRHDDPEVPDADAAEQEIPVVDGVEDEREG